MHNHFTPMTTSYIKVVIIDYDKIINAISLTKAKKY